MAESREFEILEKVANQETIVNPRTSDEVMLAKLAAGEEIIEEAETRYQYWLKQLKVDDGYQEGYADGYSDGQTAGYDDGYAAGVYSVQLDALLAEANGEYVASDHNINGFNTVTVNVPPWLANISLPAIIPIGGVVLVGVVLGSGSVSSMHINLYVRGETVQTSYIVEHFGSFSLSGDTLTFTPNTGYNVILTAYARKFTVWGE